MANQFQIKRTSVTTRTPNTTSSGNSAYIAAGELAINLADGVLYSSNGSVLITIASNASQLSTGTVATGRLGSGTANSTTFLSGDQTYKTITSIGAASTDDAVALAIALG